MASDHDPGSERLNEIIAEYLQAVEAGEAPSRDELLARHPELADELREFLDQHDSLQQAVPQSPVPPSENATIPPADLPPEEATLALGNGTVEIGTKVRYFGDYELLEEIARGGMGVVYKARQVSLNRIVALKMILAGQLASDEDVQRFQAEAEAAANLDHPGIVPIHEVGVHDGQHYFSMGFVDGESLVDRIKEGPLPPHQVVSCIRNVAEAMAFAHEHGVIHRDLKPGNILMDRNHVPRITDFGLAKRVQGDNDLTATGQVLGTPSYMPPEQAAGKTNEVGPRSDVYSIGAILYCLLTGRPPFQSANTMDTLLQVLEQEPIPPRRLNRAVPPALEIICLKCLSKTPEERYASATHLKDDLLRFEAGEAIEALPEAPLAKLAEVAKRHSWLTLLLVTAVLAALIYVAARPLAMAIHDGFAAALGVTLCVSAEAFGLGAGFGIAVGFLMRFSKTVRIALTSLLWPAQVPSLALLGVFALTTIGAPYTFMLFGIGSVRLLAIGAFVVFPRIALAVGNVANSYVLDRRWVKFKTIDTTLREVRLLAPLCFWVVYMSDFITISGNAPGLHQALSRAVRMGGSELKATLAGTLLLVLIVALLFDLGIVTLMSKARRIYMQHPDPPK